MLERKHPVQRGPIHEDTQKTGLNFRHLAPANKMTKTMDGKAQGTTLRLPRGYPEAPLKLPAKPAKATARRTQNEECRMQNGGTKPPKATSSYPGRANSRGGPMGEAHRLLRDLLRICLESDSPAYTIDIALKIKRVL